MGQTAKRERRSEAWLREHDRWIKCSCGSRMMLRNTRFGIGYFCPKCKIWHGANQKTGEPLGTPAADKETRQARIAAHEALDALWKGPDAPLDRSAAYGWLSGMMNMSTEECHIGRFNLEQCKRVVEVCEGFEMP